MLQIVSQQKTFKAKHLDRKLRKQKNVLGGKKEKMLQSTETITT